MSHSVEASTFLAGSLALHHRQLPHQLTDSPILLTTDRRIRYQQNLGVRRIALVVLTGTTKWSRVRRHADRIAAAVAAALPGSYAEVEIPLEQKSGRG